MSAALEAALRDAAAGSAPPPIALMRVLAEARSEGEARDALANASRAAAPGSPEAARLAQLAALWREHPDSWIAVRDTLALAQHDRPLDSPEAVLGFWADTFDRLAASRPEAAVALYSLGSPDLLDAATAEVVGFMDGLELLAPNRHALDLGCGIGRFLVALSSRIASVTGVDIAAGMVAEARRRTAALPNVTVRQGSGTGLPEIEDASLDIVLAADVFPYLVQAGSAVVSDHMAGFARVLRSGGAVLILNYSYRSDLRGDRVALEAAAAEHGLALEASGAGPFKTWDARYFLLRRP